MSGYSRGHFGHEDPEDLKAIYEKQMSGGNYTEGHTDTYDSHQGGYEDEYGEDEYADYDQGGDRGGHYAEAAPAPQAHHGIKGKAPAGHRHHPPEPQYAESGGGSNSDGESVVSEPSHHRHQKHRIPAPPRVKGAKVAVTLHWRPVDKKNKDENVLLPMRKLRSEDKKWWMVQRCIDRAVRLYEERPEGAVATLEEILHNYRRDDVYAAWLDWDPDVDPESLRQWVVACMARFRDHFPDVLLTVMDLFTAEHGVDQSAEGFTEWAPDGYEYKTELGDFHPGQLQRIVLDDEQVMYWEAYEKIGEKNGMEIAEAKLTAMIAHEMFHCLCGGVTGNLIEDPVFVNKTMDGPTEEGEAGFAWELATFDGRFMNDRTDRFTMYFSRSEDAVGCPSKPVKHSWVKEWVRTGSLPLPVPTYTEEEAERVNEKMQASSKQGHSSSSSSRPKRRAAAPATTSKQKPGFWSSLFSRPSAPAVAPSSRSSKSKSSHNSHTLPVRARESGGSSRVAEVDDSLAEREAHKERKQRRAREKEEAAAAEAEKQRQADDDAREERRRRRKAEKKAAEEKEEEDRKQKEADDKAKEERRAKRRQQQQQEGGDDAGDRGGHRHRHRSSRDPDKHHRSK